MQRIKVISLFFSLLVAVQMLPVKQIGQIICKGQWTEELQESSPEQKAKNDAAFKLTHLYLDVCRESGISYITESTVKNYIHSSAQIPSNHSTDVVSPPPDTIL
jgi:hypothetical protein